MNDNIFFLFMQVIEAARTGRLMPHRNGRYWYTVEYGQKVCIDIHEGVQYSVPEHDGVPTTDMGVVSSLTRFLMNQESNVQVTEWAYWDVYAEIKKAYKEGRLLHTNGGTWTYLHDDGKTVIRGELGAKAEKVRFTVYGALASWQYLQNNGTCRAVLSEGTQKFMNF